MGGDTLYVEEKLIQARRTLTVHPDGIKGRLEAAWTYLVPVTPEDLPPELRKEFQEITNDLHRKQALKAKGSDTIISSSVSQTLHLMKNKTAVAIVERLLKLHDKLSEYNDVHVRQSKRA